MEIYLQKEYYNSILLIIVSFLSIGLGLIFLFIIKYTFYVGLGFVFLVFGGCELYQSIDHVRNSKSQKNNIEFILKANHETSDKLHSKIIMQRETTLKFIWIKTTIIFFVLFGFILLKKSSHFFWKGVSLGLIIQLSLITVYSLLNIHNMNHLINL